jgi:N6-L-threonylcarbamoyladenine synthase
MSIILAIESSCDDTSAAVIKEGQILSNVARAQLDHERYGGVVPELASRQHNIHIAPIVDQALTEAKVTKHDLAAIAVTQGPGLLGSLLVGVSYAKALALGLQKPLISVHHMHAHILAHMADEPKPSFPFICLTVSGGHTQLVRVNSPIDMIVLGQTIDDAAGEAFDKAGKMLGLPYPAGPHIDRLAKLGVNKFSFSLAKVDGYDFSFSGFKTSVLYFLQKEIKLNPSFVEENMNDLCASVQSSIIQMLETKLMKVVKDTKINRVAIAGGVAANKGLRSRLEELAKIYNLEVFIPDLEYCTDNAGMVAIAAHYKFELSIFADQSLTPDPRLAF